MRSPLLNALIFYPVFLLMGAPNAAWALGGWYRVAFPAAALALMLFSLHVLRLSTPRQKMIFAVGMLVCAFGENACVHALDLYHFAGTSVPPYTIPPYVVLGHGYTIWTALVLSEEAGKRWGFERCLRWMLPAVGALTLARMALFRDLIGGAWLALFIVPYLLCRRDEDRLLLCATYFLATGLESMGVWTRAWEWHVRPYWLPSGWAFASPPAAVGGFYAAADWITLALLSAFSLDDGAVVLRPGRRLTLVE